MLSSGMVGAYSWLFTPARWLNFSGGLAQFLRARGSWPPVYARQKKSNGKGSSPAWLCKCDCGKEVIATRRSLLRKDQQSCGCLFSEKASERILKYNTLGMYQGTNTSMIRDTSKLSKSNTSGVRGVCWDASKKKWAAHIGFQSRRIKLGCYNTIEEAAAVRKAAEEQYFAPIVAQYDAEKAKAEEAVT